MNRNSVHFPKFVDLNLGLFQWIDSTLNCFMLNKHSLTIKGRFDKEKGYMTWDSHNKFEYKWEYKIGGTGGTDGLGAWTYVMPGFLVQNVSWD